MGTIDNEPATEAGRRLWRSIAKNERLSTNGVRMGEYRTAILAIEREAAGRASGGLDVEALEAAWEQHTLHDHDAHDMEGCVPDCLEEIIARLTGGQDDATGDMRATCPECGIPCRDERQLRHHVALRHQR